jgi:phosphatidate cytidylyltransferase
MVADMLKRTVSAAVAIVILAAVLFFHKTVVFDIAVGIISAGIVFELLTAFKCNRKKITFILTVIFAGAAPLLASYFNEISNGVLFSAIVFLMFGISAAVNILLHGKAYYKSEQFTLWWFTVPFLVPTALGTLIYLRDFGVISGVDSGYTILAFCGAWVSDTAAYFFGTFLGKHKICPKISPKKTWEGLIGGAVVTGIVFFCLGMWLMELKIALCFGLFALGAVCAFVGLAGDLTASLIKRKCGIKDFGNIMPGHGGILDRFDSLLFVAPFICAVILGSAFVF